MELNTQVSTLKRLKEIDISPYDAVYLGDHLCMEDPDNLNLCLRDLPEAVKMVTGQGKNAYLSTFAVPRNRDLTMIEKTLDFLGEKDLPVRMIEVHNAGTLTLVREKLPETKIHMGALSNIYTDATAELYREHGVTRITPNYELSLDEIEYIQDKSGTEAEILIFGPMVLGISEECPAGWWFREKIGNPDLCNKVVDLQSKKMNLKVRGRATLSGKYVCMIEWIPLLLEKAIYIYRLDTALLPPEMVKTAGENHKTILDLAEFGRIEDMMKAAEQIINDYLEVFPLGLCNGYYFHKSGSDFIRSHNDEFCC